MVGTHIIHGRHTYSYAYYIGLSSVSARDVQMWLEHQYIWPRFFKGWMTLSSG